MVSVKAMYVWKVLLDIVGTKTETCWKNNYMEILDKLSPILHTITPILHAFR